MEKAKSLDELLQAVVDSGGTDLHISVGAQPRVRIHGILKDLKYSVVGSSDVQELFAPLLDAYAKVQLNTNGQYDRSYTLGKKARFRVNIFNQKGDWAGVFRLLPNKILPYDKLGLPLSFFELYKKRRGLILIVGPTGSGKTTTLASFLEVINENTYKHIITLEDPIEYVHWHNRCLMNQREIGIDCDTFANGLRAALREDPDVILIGEMRDFETTEIAVTSAETGHLVCSTLHTLGASETINRVLDMYPADKQAQVRGQLSSILEAVVSQQLLPRADGNGYVVAFEIMYRNKAIKEFIQNNDVRGIDEYLWGDEARNEGMVAMDASIYTLYRNNKITKETALDYAFDRKRMSTVLNG